ncbi:hypothetical protein AZE42_11499 [Rhizopogon vesiculosus]|uniref:Cytochrome P450 n=1 Tax=Rhizopogon vesiculosus TaxID=180088 RepID=A0A1J8Q5F9_9AGAM|nr:hypothetical protein AZE42_11499 [Rhizopogon vesiculosus]
MDPVFSAVGFLVLVIVYRVYRRYTGISLADVPGPESPSFMMGEDHKRQRKVLSPGFGAPESKAFLPLFQGCAESVGTEVTPYSLNSHQQRDPSQLSNKWMDVIMNSKEQSAVLNIPAWLSRATLDAIGEAAFDVRFGSIDNEESALARAYSNMMNDIFGSPSNERIFFREVSKYIPDRILQYLVETSNNPGIQRAREVASLATSLARQMVTDKAEMLLQGKGNRDVFSLLGVCTPSFRSSTSNRSTVKANMDTDAKEKLTEEELYALMRTILLAGHETTSNTISWALLELARHPEMQSRLRAEIRETEVAIHARGDTEFTVTDLDDMTYATAFIKEVLRFHPVVYQVYRCANQDDVLPLSQPITTRLGKVIHELPVQKGTRIVVSVAAYNRNKDLWGDDAHVFNPERWINGAAKEKKATSIGVYSNLMTFLSGARACIGWRFAVIEIQAFLTEVVGKFEFTLIDQSGRVRREASGVMTPTLEGEVEKGVQLPLRVSVALQAESGY